MPQKSDDYEALRTIVNALKPFDAKDQERIIRWAKEKLGLSVDSVPAPAGAGQPPPGGQPPPPPQAKGGADIKEFVAQKNPSSENQFAAVVAYYYRFEAPEGQRKDAITKEDLQEACRLANVDRLKNPKQTLINTHHAGLLDRGERGAYTINSVGENLVAMTLPSAARVISPRKHAGKRPRKKSKK